jgi:hypothetical protein
MARPIRQTRIVLKCSNLLNSPQKHVWHLGSYPAQVLLTAYLEATHDTASPAALDDLGSSDGRESGQ